MYDVLIILKIIKIVVIYLTVRLIISRGVLAQRHHQRIKNLRGERTVLQTVDHGCVLPKYTWRRLVRISKRIAWVSAAFNLAGLQKRDLTFDCVSFTPR